MPMPAVPITSREQYQNAIEVLTRVGGTWQGVGFEEWVLLVTEAQYNALVAAKVTTPADTIEEAKDFFRQLRWILEQKQVASQEVVLIEHTTAWLVEASPLPGK